MSWLHKRSPIFRSEIAPKIMVTTAEFSSLRISNRVMWNNLIIFLFIDFWANLCLSSVVLITSHIFQMGVIDMAFVHPRNHFIVEIHSVFLHSQIDPVPTLANGKTGFSPHLKTLQSSSFSIYFFKFLLADCIE